MHDIDPKVRKYYGITAEQLAQIVAAYSRSGVGNPDSICSLVIDLKRYTSDKIKHSHLADITTAYAATGATRDKICELLISLYDLADFTLPDEEPNIDIEN
jgi:hypothetical protein